MVWDGWSPVDMNAPAAYLARTITSDYTPTQAMETLLVDCTDGDVTITLPASTVNGATEYRIIKKDNTGNYVYINASGSDTIMDFAQVVLQNQWESYDLVAASGLYVAVGAL